MLLLVTDTSGKHGFVGLARTVEGTQPDQIKVIEEVPLAGGTFSAQLVPQIAGLFQKHSVSKTDIDAFIVVSGPGSFTGLRVGLAAIKALAEILHKPIVAVSLLEVIARSVVFVAGQPDDISQLNYAVALDAGRGEAFVGQYVITFVGGKIDSFRCEDESLLSVQSLAELAESGARQWVIAPDAVLRDALKEKLGLPQERAVLPQAWPGTEEVATLGWMKLRAGEEVSPAQLEANYIRHSDAEIFAKPFSSS